MTLAVSAIPLVAESLIKVETEDQLKTTFKEVHEYLDLVVKDNDKPRIAVDTETYICKEARDLYDLEYSKKVQTAKEKKENILNIVKCPKYPVPKPHKNKWGFIDCRVRLLQIGFDPDRVNTQYVIDLDKIYWSIKSRFTDIFEFYEYIGKTYLQPLFDRSWNIGQNLAYEFALFWKLFKAKMRIMRDTFLMSQVLWMGDVVNHKLADLYKLYIKDEKLFIHLTGKTFAEYADFKEAEAVSPWYNWDLEEHQYCYAAEDVYLIWFAFKALMKQLVVWAKQHDDPANLGGVLDVAVLECELIAAVAKTSTRGVPFNVDFFYQDAKPFLEEKMKEAQDEVNRIAGQYTRTKKIKKKRTIGRGANKVIEHYEEEKVVTEEYNLGSWQQIRALTGLSKEVLESTGAEDLFFFKDSHEAVKWIIQYKKAQKLLSFFTSSKSGWITLLDSDNKLHCGIHQIGMEDDTIASGRMSKSKPNLSQVPQQKSFCGRKIKTICRKPFWAPPGFKYVILDFSQIEPRLTAKAANDAFLRSCFIMDRDMHAETAKTVFLLPFLPIKGHPEEHWRDKGKIMRLARTYLMGLDKAMKSVYVDTEGELDYYLRGDEGREEFMKVLNLLDSTTPQVSELRERIEAEVRSLPTQCKSFYPFRNGDPYYVSVSMYGRTRRFALNPVEKAQVKANPADWHMAEKVLYQKTGKISTWANKFNQKCRDAAREGFNNYIQSSAADIFKLSIVAVDKMLDEEAEQGVIDEEEEGIILYCHDEIVLLLREEEAERIGLKAKKIMEEVGQPFLGDIPCKVGMSIGDSWEEK